MSSKILVKLVRCTHMIDEVFFDGVRYVSANDAALSAGLTRDYVTKMCRLGKFDGRHVGKNWYVEHTSFQNFLIYGTFTKDYRSCVCTHTNARNLRCC